jgi:plasmid stability protein
MLYRTTVRIDDELLAELKALAARQHRTLNSVMEEAFRRMLTAARAEEQRPRVKLTTYGGKGPHLTPRQIKDALAEQDFEHFMEVMSDDSAGHERPDLRP